jgi:hypothetical protein
MKSKNNKKTENNLFFVGGRLGFANFKYDLTNVVITDDYCPNVSLSDQRSHKDKAWKKRELSSRSQ